MPFDATPATSDQLAEVRNTRAGIPREPMNTYEQLSILFPETPITVGEHEPGNHITDLDDTFDRRLLYAFFRLAAQRVTTEETIAGNHAARLEAHRYDTTADVRVVQLRAAHDHSRQTVIPAGWIGSIAGSCRCTR